jgi:hypothetical protein
MQAHIWQDYSQKTERMACHWTACQTCGVLKARDGSLDSEECKGKAEQYRCGPFEEGKT